MGVASLRLMADDTHDVGLIPVVIQGVAHGFAVNSQAFVLLTINLVPALQGPVEILGIDADQKIADDVLTGDHVMTVFAATPETFPRLGAEALGPIRDGPVSPHPTQDGPSGNGQNRGHGVTSPLGAAGIGDSAKERG